MKRGELVILWVGGLLSVAVLSDVRANDLLGLGTYSVATVLNAAMRAIGKLTSIWILCGLAWVTFYRREKRE